LPVATPVTLVTEGCLGQTNDTSILSAGDQDPVMVCISEIEEMAAATDLSSLNFIWSKDGQTDEEQSGSGKSSYALVPTKPAGEEHIITVQVKDTMTSDEIINSERPFAIAGPSVNIIDPENQNADIETAESYKYSRVDPGEQLNCRAEIEHFTGNDSREVAWSVGGATGETYTTEEKEIFFTFEVPPEAADGDSYSIGVQVQSQGDQGTEQASDNIILTVGPPGGQTGAATNFFGNLAAAFTKIPEVFREVLKYVAIMALVFFGLIYVYPKVARYLGK